MNSYQTGILTFWNVPNYGTFIQAYALQKTVEMLTSKSTVHQIAYLHPTHFDFYYSMTGNQKFTSLSFYKQLLHNLLLDHSRRDRKSQFLNAYRTIPHTSEFGRKDLARAKFDTVILGSDIIWDFSFSIFGNDPYLFGVGLNTNKKIAYSASFGTIKPDDDFPSYVKEGLSQLEHISVRDQNSAQIIQRLCGFTPTITLDPVWLWDFNNDPNIETPEYQNYIAVYGQDFTQEFIENLIQYAKHANKTLICLDCNDDNPDWCDVLIKQQDMSPYQWLGFFKNAECIATSTFHGLTFGLLFNKRTAFCKTPFIMAKAELLLTELDLYDLFLKDNDVAAMLNHSWDYQSINQVIQKKRADSLSFLRRALEID